MRHSQRFIILLAVTTSFILIADRIKAEKTTFIGCTGKHLDEKNLGFRKFYKFRHNLNDITLPERFDSREKWSYCKSVFHIKQQYYCGGCWICRKSKCNHYSARRYRAGLQFLKATSPARTTFYDRAFASSSVMADRLCIATQGKYNKILSEQDLIECCVRCTFEFPERVGGCFGGYPTEAFNYWEHYGVVTGYQGCKPIEESTLNRKPQMACRQRCTNESYKVEYKTDRTFSVKTFLIYPAQKGDIKHIMAEIMLNGPVGGSIQVYWYMSDILHQATILKVNKSLEEGQQPAGLHAIKIIGWDNINGTPVWIISNSWGTDWCDKGFCYVRRGQNDLEVEVKFYAGIPKILKGTNKPKQIEKTETSKTEISGSHIIKITNPIELAVILCTLTI